MAKKASGVPRPLKSTEYSIELMTSQAVKGSTDLLATQKNAVADLALPISWFALLGGSIIGA